jgi:hypothetical protein
MELGIPVAISGARWDKAPEWPILRKAWRASHLDGDEYAYAVQCAKLCIGLLSSGNRDLHTQRSIEIPSLGSVLCAQRTKEHEQLYVDGVEGIFWDTVQDCAQVCRALLEDPVRRARIALRGRQRCLRNGHFNENLLRRVIDEAFA